MENEARIMTLRDYLRVVFRHEAVVITSFITVMVTVALGIMYKTPNYKAVVTMLVSGAKPVESPYYRDLSAMSNLSLPLTQSEIVRSDPVMEMTVKALGLWQKPLDYECRFASPLKSALVKLEAKSTKAKMERLPEDQQKAYAFRMALEDLRNNVKVEPVRDTNLFTITATDFSAMGSAIIANAVSRAYVVFDLQQQAAELQLKYGEKHPAALQLQESIEKMEKNLTGVPLPNIEAIGPASVKVMEQASIPLEPSGPSHKIIGILALFMASFLSVMLAFVFEYADQTFKDPADIEDFLNVPCLGFIPKKAKVENYRDLADQIYLILRDRGAKTSLFCGALADEGVTTTLANVGQYFAQAAGCRTLLIDANLRRPFLHSRFNLPETEGLADVICGKISLDKSIKKAGNNLDVIVAGKTSLNPVTLLSSHVMADILKEAKNRYDLVLVDSPALNEFRDALIIGPYLDTVTLVINERKTRRQVVKAAIAPFERSKTNVIGALLNKRTFPIPKGIYHRV